MSQADVLLDQKKFKGVDDDEGDNGDQPEEHNEYVQDEDAGLGM